MARAVNSSPKLYRLPFFFARIIHVNAVETVKTAADAKPFIKPVTRPSYVVLYLDTLLNTVSDCRCSYVESVVSVSVRIIDDTQQNTESWKK